MQLNELLFEAFEEVQLAMKKFPQPNYVISKVAEESGEVVKAAIHLSEGRETKENLLLEIKQAMAMLMRLALEGDQVHGCPPVLTDKEPTKEPRQRPMCGSCGYPEGYCGQCG